MHFELSQEICDLIIFGMENQESRQLFDTKSLVLVREDSAIQQSVDDSADASAEFEPFEERYLALPAWRSVDGYSLMESFVGTLHNPLQREALKQILQSGRGVFRQFKDTLKSDPDAERLWFRYKQKEMRRRVQDWYNDLREYWGLEPKSFASDNDYEDLILSDFVIQAVAGESSQDLVEWDKRLFTEAMPDCPAWEIDYQYQLRRQNSPKPAADGHSPVYGAFSPGGELCGFIWLIETDIGTPHGPIRVARIAQWGVVAEFRGLGMAGALLHYVTKASRDRNIHRLFIDMPAGLGFLAKNLDRSGWKSYYQTWQLELDS